MALYRGVVLAGKLMARMLRKRFQTVVFLAFLVFSLAIASEKTADDEDEVEELPQCPVTSANSEKQTPKTQTDSDDDADDDGKADDEAADGDDGDGEADNDDPPQEELPCVPALEEQSIDDDTPSSNETLADDVETFALAGTLHARASLLQDNSLNSLIYHIKGVMSVCLFVCLYAGDGGPNGWADQDQTWHGDSC